MKHSVFIKWASMVMRTKAAQKHSKQTKRFAQNIHLGTQLEKTFAQKKLINGGLYKSGVGRKKLHKLISRGTVIRYIKVAS